MRFGKRLACSQPQRTGDPVSQHETWDLVVNGDVQLDPATDLRAHRKDTEEKVAFERTSQRALLVP